MIEAMEADGISLGNDVRWGEKKGKGDTYGIPVFKELAEKEKKEERRKEKFREVGGQRSEYYRN